MELPAKIRDTLVTDIDAYIDAVASPEVEPLVGFLIESLESLADDYGMDDVISELEEEGAVDGSLSDLLEEEMESNEEFAFTGEEIVNLLERVSGVEWGDDINYTEEDSLDDLDD